MAKLTRLTPEIRADFVAYLDGELDEEATERIETIIAQNEVARSDMEALAQTYEYLDALERSQASEDFAERTMATIRVDELRPDVRNTKWYRGAQAAGLFAVWTAVLAGTAVIGYQATHRWTKTDADRLVEELPLIERLDIYTEVGSFEFLDRLNRQDALLQEMSPESEGADES